jgi:hypothetical protein
VLHAFIAYCYKLLMRRTLLLNAHEKEKAIQHFLASQCPSFIYHYVCCNDLHTYPSAKHPGPSDKYYLKDRSSAGVKYNDIPKSFSVYSILFDILYQFYFTLMLIWSFFVKYLGYTLRVVSSGSSQQNALWIWSSPLTEISIIGRVWITEGHLPSLAQGSCNHCRIIPYNISPHAQPREIVIIGNTYIIV